MNDITPLEELRNSLTFQEELFCSEYVERGVIVDAAQAAGIGNTYASSAQMGSRLYKRPEIKAYIRHLKDEKLRELHITPDGLLAELAKMAGFAIGDLLDTDGHLDFSKLDAKSKAALKSVKRKPGQYGTSVEVEGHDKLKAIELLMNHAGMLKTGPQVAVQVNVDFGERMAARRAKALEG